MSLLSPKQRAVAEAIAAIGYCNPFLPERIELERRALRTEFIGQHEVMFLPPGADSESTLPNAAALQGRALEHAEAMREQLVSGVEATESDLRLYEDLVLYLLYSRHRSSLSNLAEAHQLGNVLDCAIPFWKEFEADFHRYLKLPGLQLPSRHTSDHVLAVFFQIERAFRNIFYHIRGRSLSIARLRADVWCSIFTHDMRCYARAIHGRIHEIPTLILGESGTGKELVAKAIGLSQFVPFDANRTCFGFSRQPMKELSGRSKSDFQVPDGSTSFRAVNLSALVSTLVESELFGYVKGAHDQARSDKLGWLEICHRGGAVFLDEIGELDYSLQTKLLRVVQFREFERVGDTTTRAFQGKFIAATNRDLQQEIQAGRFRDDLYFRLCADQIVTSPLRVQLQESPEDRDFLVNHVAGEILKGFPKEGEQLANTVNGWIRTHLPADYQWPGNMRELEQCARNVMIRNSYRPPQLREMPDRLTGREKLSRLVAEVKLTEEELLEHYASLAFVVEGTYTAAAQKLGVDWRTLKEHVRDELIELYQEKSLSELR